MAQVFTFGATGLLTVPTGWKRTSGPSAASKQKQRAVALDEGGVETAAKVHSEANQWDEQFVAVSDTITIPVCGKQTTGPAIVAIKITTGLQYATMTLTGVENAGDAPSNTYTHGITLTKAFGANDFLDGIAGTAKLISGNVSITMKVNTAFDGDGTCIATELSEGTIEASSTWKNTPYSPAGITWDVLSAKNDSTNTDWYQYDVTGTVLRPAAG
ncbi:MAG: hypothetical protein ACOYOU_03345 [Kiritimatiellia bacterium]